MTRPRMLCPYCKRSVSVSHVGRLIDPRRGIVARHKTTLTEWCSASGKGFVYADYPVPAEADL